MDKQNKYTKQLLELIQQNPSLRVLPLVHWEVCAGDEHSYWSGEFGESKVEEIYMDTERIWIRSEDEESMIDNVFDDIETTDIKSDDEAMAKAVEIVKNYDWEKVIAVYIET